MLNLESQNYYEILDIKPDASSNDIRQAYFRVKSAYSKDSAALYSLFDDQETKAILGLLEEAYHILSNPEKRKEYDRVHGFLSSSTSGSSSNHSSVPKSQSISFEKNVFSFSEPASSSEKNSAEEIADNLFGNSSMEKEKPKPPQKPTPRMSLSTPSASTPVKQEGNEDVDFQYRENRLGIVRRVDLIKDSTSTDQLEEEIKTETQFRGTFLRKIREHRKISIDELSEFTKISKAYISCIEAEEFESLPAPAYLRGFVVQIAKALKIPHDPVAKGYMQNYKNTVLK